MPFLGAHMSVAGGLSRAVERAVVHRCRALQIFAKNANQWRGRPLDVSEIAEFRASVERAALVSVVSHASYLINLAATTEAVREQSRIAMADEIDRAEALGLLGVVLHPGAHLSAGREEALRLVAVELLSLFDQRRAGKTMVLLEGTAGQGTCLGARFEELAAIIDAAGGHPRLGVCLDTCHLLAAGYDIASVDGYRRTFDEFGQIVGFDRLRVVHLNDSKRALGSRVDRHEHIGTGYLGLESFRRLLNDERFASMPMILETPKGQGKATGPIAIDPLDERNLNTLRSLLPAPMGPTPRPPGCASI